MVLLFPGVSLLTTSPFASYMDISTLFIPDGVSDIVNVGVILHVAVIVNVGVFVAVSVYVGVTVGVALEV